MTIAPLSILLVDDDPTEATAIREMLGRMSMPIELVEVSSLEEASEHLCHDRCPNSARCLGNRFDIVLLDLHLPNGVGLSCVSALRELCRGTSIVVLTKHTDMEIPSYFAAGADDFLEMGASQRQLEAVIYRSGRSAVLKRDKKKKWGTISKKLSVLERITDTLVEQRHKSAVNS